MCLNSDENTETPVAVSNTAVHDVCGVDVSLLLSSNKSTRLLVLGCSLEVGQAPNPQPTCRKALLPKSTLNVLLGRKTLLTNKGVWRYAANARGW